MTKFEALWWPLKWIPSWTRNTTEHDWANSSVEVLSGSQTNKSVSDLPQAEVLENVRSTYRFTHLNDIIKKKKKRKTVQ